MLFLEHFVCNNLKKGLFANAYMQYWMDKSMIFMRQDDVQQKGANCVNTSDRMREVVLIRKKLRAGMVFCNGPTFFGIVGLFQ